MRPVAGPLILVIVAFVLWRLWAPEAAFVRGFASLLEQSVTAGRRWWHLLVGRDHTGGTFRGCEVVLVFHSKRGRHDLGYLIVAMRPPRPLPAALESAGALREAVARSSARDAWDDLELKYELQLSCAEGFLRARWMPAGFVIFPGRFEPERWRRVLEAMHTIVNTLEHPQNAPAV